MKKPILSLLACWLSLQVAVPLGRAQQPGGLDPSFAPAKVDVAVQQIVACPGGRALVAGRFTTVNDTPVGPVVQLKADGTLDPDFANNNRSYLPAGDTKVNSIVVATDAFDRTYVAITSTPSFNGTLVRLYANGALDTGFHATIDGAPNAMVAQPNGQVIIAGSFSTLNGVTVQGNVARLKEDGSTDTTFDPGPRPGVPTPAFTFIYNLALQADGKLIVGGGLFPSFNAGLARLNSDGSTDATFALSNIPGLTFQDLLLLPGGDLLATYNTPTFDGQPYAYAARIKTHTADGTDGQLDPAFQPGNALPTFPRKTVVQTDGKLVFNLGGSIVRLDPDGSADRAFTFGAPSNTVLGVVYAQTTDGNLLAAGTLYVGGQYLEGVARLFGSVSGGATTVNVVVPGTANPWLARDGSTDAADTVPSQAPVRVVDLALNAGATLSFTADGAVDNAGSLPTGTPDGGSPFTHESENGVSGITAPLNGLVGVFIDDAAAGNVATPPDPLDFSTDASRDYLTLSPALGQMFFIGDGKTSGGAVQQVTVPAGARHLVLGSVDGFGWYNNTGAFAVTITPGDGGGNNNGGLNVPGTANLWLAGQDYSVFASNGADKAPGQSPVQIPNLTLDPNKGLTFDVTGNVTTGGTVQQEPDGGDFVTHAAENGVSGVKTHLGALIGVFVGDDAPSASARPNDLDYTLGAGVSANSYSPRLQQAFFIGNGEDTLTRTQTFYPPEGATRLFLGVMDNTVFNNNGGAFQVNVTTSAVDPSDLRVGENVTSSSTPGGNGSFALIGDVLTYTFTVRNFSQTALKNVSIRDALPSYIDPARTVVGDGFINDNAVVWSVGDLAPGATATRTLQVTLTKAAPLGLHYTNKGYTATADGFPNVTGRDFPDTLIESAVSVKITNNTATARPGGTVRFIYDLTNTTPTKFKKLTLTVPFLQGLYFSKAYFADSSGNAKPVDATGKLTARYDQPSNSAVFTLNALKGGDEVFLVLEATVALDFDPKGLVNLPGAQIVISKYTDGQPITLALDDSANALSGLPAEAPPKLAFGKSIVTGDIVTLLLAANPASATLLNSITLKPYLDLNPNQKNVQKIGAFTNLALLTSDQKELIFNPFIGSDTDADTGATVTTVAAPGAKPPNPFVTFALVYTNTGAGTAREVVISDSVPKGLEIDRDSFFVNGVATLASAIQFNNDGSFALTAKNIKPNKGGLIFYRAKVLVPTPPPDGVDLGGYIEPTSAQLSIAYLGSEVIAPAPEKILLTGPVHASISSTQTGDTATGGNVTYTMLYRNDGGQTITDFRVVSPVPPGGAFQSAQLLGVDQQPRMPNTAKSESLTKPAVGATSGLMVFHLGKVKPRGFGLVQVVYQMTSAVLQQSTQALVHQPYIAATGGLPVANHLPGDAPLHRQLRRIVTRDAGDTSIGAADSADTTHPADNPNGPHLGMTVSCFQSVVASDTIGYTVTAISLGNTNLSIPFIPYPYDPFVFFSVPVPDGTDYVGITGGIVGPADVTAKPFTDTSGRKYITGQFPALPNKGASWVTVSFRANGAASTTVLNPDIVLYDPLSATVLHSGPIVTTVVTPNDFFNIQRLVLLNTLNAPKTTTFTGPGFQQRVDQLNSKSRFTAVINAGYMALENGVLVIPTAEGNIVAQGGGNLVNTNGSNIVAQGGGNIVAQGGGNVVAQGGGNIIAQGGGNLISIKNIVNDQGQLIGQDGNGFTVANIFAGIVAQGGGNLQALHCASIVAQGGGNLQSVGVGVISRDGAGFAASADRVLAASAVELATGQSKLSGDVFRTSSGDATLMSGGFVGAAGAGGIKIDGLIRGTKGSSFINNTSAVGGVVRAGSGIIGENSSGIVAQGGGN